MPFLQGPQNLSQTAAPLSLLLGPPSHPQPRVTSHSGRAPSARRSGDEGHGGVSGYLTRGVFFSFPQMKSAPAQKEAVVQALKQAVALAPQPSPSAELEAVV